MVRYVTNPNPVTEVHVGMTGSSIGSTFVVKEKKHNGWFVETTVNMIGRSYSYVEKMLVEDILRLCDANKGHWE